MVRKFTCVRCGDQLEGMDAWLAQYAVHFSGLCAPCREDSFDCARCNRKLPKSEASGAYCRTCRSEYNHEHYLRRRRVSP